MNLMVCNTITATVMQLRVLKRKNIRDTATSRHPESSQVSYACSSPALSELQKQYGVSTALYALFHMEFYGH